MRFMNAWTMKGYVWTIKKPFIKTVSFTYTNPHFAYLISPHPIAPLHVTIPKTILNMILGRAGRAELPLDSSKQEGIVAPIWRKEHDFMNGRECHWELYNCQSYSHVGLDMFPLITHVSPTCTTKNYAKSNMIKWPIIRHRKRRRKPQNVNHGCQIGLFAVMWTE